MEQKVKEIVAAIEKDLNGRKGFDLDSLEEFIQDEIRESWTDLVREILEK